MERIQLTRGEGVFAQGTVGFTLFPDALEGRSRPATTFNQPLSSFRTRTAVVALEAQGVHTVADYLTLPQESVKELGGSPVIQKRIGTYLEHLTVVPHLVVARKILGEDEYSAPLLSPGREQDVIEGMESALGTINPRYRRVVELRFGLVDGITRTLEELSPGFKVTDERIRQMELTGFRHLRRRARRQLFDISVLPSDSLGRQVLGGELFRDTNHFHIPVNHIDWRDESIERTIQAHYYGYLDLLLQESGEGLEQQGISDYMREKIIEVTQKATAEGPDSILKPSK